LGSLHGQASASLSEANLKLALAAEVGPDDDTTALLKQYDTYDRYFNVYRFSAMTAGQFIAQTAASCQRLLADLPYTALDIDERLTIARVTGELFATLAARYFPEASASAQDRDPLSTESAESAPFPTQPDGMEPPARVSSPDVSSNRTQRIAFERWRAGHHFFDLCAMFGRDQLIQAATALAAGNEPAVAQALRTSALFLRGTTAAMWYAGNFPQAIYERVIRPSMVSTGMPHGFSGTQNLDYRRFKDTKEQLQEPLKGRYGRNVDRWPSALGQAFITFHETDIADTEAHTLIIIAKTGLDQSLAQHEGQRGLPPNAPRLNAVAQMRALTDERRQEFDY
jgi:hypothetical protein